MAEDRTRAGLVALGTHLPEGRLTNEEIVERWPDWTPEMIEEKTGIVCRRIAADDEFTSDLAVKAAEDLFARDPSLREGIDALFLTTVTPDYIVPSTAPLVHDRLGLPKSVGAFDVTLGCSGYTYGLSLAASMVESGRYRRILFITADRFATCAAAGGPSVQTIIGDGATASLVDAIAPGDERRVPIIGATRVGTDGTGAEKLITRTSGLRGWVGAEQGDGVPAFEMVGPDVFQFTLREIVPHIKEFLADQGLAVADVDAFVFHQANLFMLEHLRRRLRATPEQLVLRIREIGNTVSSSIPLALDEAWQEGRIPPGANVLLCAFGVGFSWGSVLLHFPD